MGKVANLYNSDLRVKLIKDPDPFHGSIVHSHRSGISEPGGCWMPFLELKYNTPVILVVKVSSLFSVLLVMADG